VHHAW